MRLVGSVKYSALLSVSSGLITDVLHNRGCEYLLVVCTLAVDIKVVVKLVCVILTALLDQQAYRAVVPVEGIQRSRHTFDELHN